MTLKYQTNHHLPMSIVIMHNDFHIYSKVLHIVYSIGLGKLYMLLLHCILIRKTGIVLYKLSFTQLIVYYYYVLPIYQIELRNDWNLKAGHSV